MAHFLLRNVVLTTQTGAPLHAESAWDGLNDESHASRSMYTRWWHYNDRHANQGKKISVSRRRRRWQKLHRSLACLAHLFPIHGETFPTGRRDYNDYSCSTMP